MGTVKEDVRRFGPARTELTILTHRTAESFYLFFDLQELFPNCCDENKFMTEMDLVFKFYLLLTLILR